MDILQYKKCMMVCKYPYMQKDYVNMRDKNVNMQLIYASMHHHYVDMQFFYVAWSHS